MKDPAFLFYSSDFLAGTMLMSDEQVGKYIRLLCYQHMNGHISEEDMKQICKTYDKHIYSHFTKDEEGNYYNQRLEDEIKRRKDYSESRRKNRSKKQEETKEEEKEEPTEKDMNNICSSHDKHMGTGTETGTKTKNIIGNKKIFNNKSQLQYINPSQKEFEDLDRFYAT